MSIEQKCGRLLMLEEQSDFAPIRVPQVLSGQDSYVHIPLAELYEKRARSDQRLFYAYELLGKGRGCLRLSKAPASGRLKIFCDRVLAIPKLATEQVDLPDNMLALLQAHIALALAMRFHNYAAVPALKERVASCSAWFMRHQSAIDRDCFLDPGNSYGRFK